MFKHYIFIVFLMALLSCTKDLERDNILDENNNTNIQNGVTLKLRRYSIYTEQNNDFKINPNETIKLYFIIRNNGTSKAENVYATFSSTSNSIAYIDNSIKSFGSINSGDSSYNYSSVTIVISSSATDGELVPITASIKDKNGSIWKETIYILISKPDTKIVFFKSELVYETNNNGKINKGEDAYLEVYLTNTGYATGESIKAYFTSTSSYITSIIPTSPNYASYNNITYGGNLSTNYSTINSEGYTLRLKINSSTPSNTIIPITINISDKYNNTWTSTMNITVY